MVGILEYNLLQFKPSFSEIEINFCSLIWTISHKKRNLEYWSHICDFLSLQLSIF